MSSSKRVYITLNPKKEKDLIILNYLNSTYNDAETIKSVLYQIATNGCYEVNMVHEKIEESSIGEEQKDDNSVQKVQNVQYDRRIEGNDIAIDDDIKNLFG